MGVMDVRYAVVPVCPCARVPVCTCARVPVPVPVAGVVLCDVFLVACVRTHLVDAIGAGDELRCVAS